MPSLQTENTSRPRKIIEQFSYLTRAVKLVWTAAPGWMIAWAVILLVQGILPVAVVYLTKLIVDNLVSVRGAGLRWEVVQPTMVLLALMAGVLLLMEILQSTADWIRTAQAEVINDHITNLLQQQALALDISFFESPEYYDHLEQARGEAASRPRALLESGGSMAQSLVTLIAMAVMLTRFGYWLPPLLVVSTLPGLLVLLRFDRVYRRWWQRTTADRRRMQYFDLLLTHGMSAAEIRLFNLGEHFRTAYQSLRKRLRTERLRQIRNLGLARLGASTAGLLMVGGLLLWMLRRVFQGLATLGDLALFYQVIDRGQGVMRSMMSSVSQIYNNVLFLQHLFTFLDLRPVVDDPAEPKPAPARIEEGISFNNITFRYPGSQTVALQDFNLAIPAGKLVAIVGPNGAGKTTLVKLLCRYYDPEAGTIELDGVNIRNISVKELWRSITMLFQFPLLFHTTARQSIAFGDVEQEQSDDDLEMAARRAGAHEFITRLPQGYDTKLGKQFNEGVELSGGQWQRIALARAYVRQAPIMILDEPTSAMDSWAEAEWFEQLRNLARGRTVIVITHRFTIAMRADAIHVMNEGQVVESGSHQELLRENGLYAKSWKAQMQAGVLDEEDLNISETPYGIESVSA